MYPHPELIQLAERKVALRREITRLRVHCADAAVRAARPLVVLDRVVAFVRRLSPLAILTAVPLGLAVQRTLFPRRKVLGMLVRWGPPLFAAVRGLRAK